MKTLIITDLYPGILSTAEVNNITIVGQHDLCSALLQSLKQRKGNPVSGKREKVIPSPIFLLYHLEKHGKGQYSVYKVIMF